MVPQGLAAAASSRGLASAWASRPPPLSDHAALQHPGFATGAMTDKGYHKQRFQVTVSNRCGHGRWAGPGRASPLNWETPRAQAARADT